MHSDEDGLFWSSTLKRCIHLLRNPSSTSEAIPMRYKVQCLEHLELSQVQHCFTYRAFKCCLIRCHEKWQPRAWGHASSRPPAITSIQVRSIPALVSFLDLQRLLLCWMLKKLASASAQSSLQLFTNLETQLHQSIFDYSSPAPPCPSQPGWCQNQGWQLRRGLLPRTSWRICWVGSQWERFWYLFQLQARTVSESWLAHILFHQAS